MQGLFFVFFFKLLHIARAFFMPVGEEVVFMPEEKNERVCKRLQSILFNFDDGYALRHYLAFFYLADICPDLTVAEARDLIDRVEDEMKEIPFLN